MVDIFVRVCALLPCYGHTPQFAQIRTGFIKHGLLVTDAGLIFKSYIQKRQYMDVLSVIPLELLFLPLGYNPAWRFNRLLKVGRWMRFESKFEHRTSNANIWRLVFLYHKLIMVMHYDACFYYLISKGEGFGINLWVLPAAVASSQTCSGCVDASYGNRLHQYLASLNWASTNLMVRMLCCQWMLHDRRCRPLARSIRPAQCRSSSSSTSTTSSAWASLP